MAQQNQTSAQDLLSQYTVQTPSVANAYMQSFGKGGPINVPSFQELYGSYRNVAERETGRQSAALNGAFGSQGARYSSDLLNAQSRLRENLGTDLSNQAGMLLQNLRGQQFNEASYLSNLQANQGEAGMNRLFQDFLRRTSPPPLLANAQNFTQGFGFGAPTTAIY